MTNSSDWVSSALETEEHLSQDDHFSQLLPARRRLNSHDEYNKHHKTSSSYSQQQSSNRNNEDNSPKRRQYSLGSYNRPRSPRHSSKRNSNTTTNYNSDLSKTSHAPSRIQNSALSAANSSMASATKESNKRVYRGSDNRFVTRDIAALDFLLGIPLAAEPQLVTDGWALQQRKVQDEQHFGKDVNTIAHAAHGTWWEKYIRKTESNHPTGSSVVKQGIPNHSQNSMMHMNQQDDDDELERPNHVTFTQEQEEQKPTTKTTADNVIQPAYTPGRRLDGDIAIRVKIPVTHNLLIQTKQKAVARQATIREWEQATAHGLRHAPMLDGRLFFSADSSYPVSVFSVIRYEPRREHAAFMRKKLESLGGGGSQFVMPTRDWRGISYRALLPPRQSKHNALNRQYHEKAFNRFLSQHSVRSWKENGSNSEYDTVDDDEKSGDSLSDDDDSVEPYVPGVLDDPEMVLGRHRNVMIGDHVIGPMVTSTIQFVKPELLKAELNKQFREQFDGWEPPKAARKFIGAYVNVQEGKYLLKDPAEAETSAAVDMTNTSNHTSEDTSETKPNRRRQSSVTSAESVGESTVGLKEIPILRIPPSLTLSKIRSVKEQALRAAVMANLEIGSVALACVYFERLCLDCRVDKSNRRLAFAACLLLAAKLNEPNVGLVITTATNEDEKEDRSDFPTKIVSLVKPNKRSNNMFANLLEFFTQEWSLSIKNLLDAEWGVFAALRFTLHATPLQVAFHFRRLLKSLALSPREYLGEEMWEQWQEAMEIEEQRNRERERRIGLKRKRKEERLRDLQMELENEVMRLQKNVEGEALRRSQGTMIDNKSWKKDDETRGENFRASSDRLKSFSKSKLSGSQLESDGTYSSQRNSMGGDDRKQAASTSAGGKSFLNRLNPVDHNDRTILASADESNTATGTPRNRVRPSRGAKPPLRSTSSGGRPFLHLRSSSDVQDSEDERRRGRKALERTSSGRKFFNRLGVRRIVSVDRMAEKFGDIDLEQGNIAPVQGNTIAPLRQSPSMPILYQAEVPDFVAITIPDNRVVTRENCFDDDIEANKGSDDEEVFA